jgi:hypothetical protein
MISVGITTPYLSKQLLFRRSVLITRCCNRLAGPCFHNLLKVIDVAYFTTADSGTVVVVVRQLTAGKY